MYVVEGNMETEVGSTSLRNELGFSLLEALVAMLITLVILSTAFGAFKSMADVNTASVHSVEVTQNMQSSLTIIRRDLQRTGQGVPNAGIPVPTGTTYTNDSIFGLEPEPNSISVLYMINNGVDAGTTLQNNDGDGTRLVVSAADFARINNGDLVLLTNAAGNEITQRVTGLNATNRWVLFQRGVTATQSRINRNFDDPNIDPFIGAPNINFTVYRRITYSQATDTDGIPWLMRQVNENAVTRMVPGVSRFNLTYQASAITDNSLSPFAEFGDFARFSDIRLVTINLVCLSDESITNGECNYISAENYTGACAPNGVVTDVAIRRYRNRFASVPNP